MEDRMAEWMEDRMEDRMAVLLADPMVVRKEPC
jgi:hypothetical protein